MLRFYSHPIIQPCKKYKRLNFLSFSKSSSSTQIHFWKKKQRRYLTREKICHFSKVFIEFLWVLLYVIYNKLVFFLSCGLVWFGWYNQNRKPKQTMRLSKKNGSNTSEPNAVFCGFGLDLFGLRFFYWIGLVFNTPNQSLSNLQGPPTNSRTKPKECCWEWRPSHAPKPKECWSWRGCIGKKTMSHIG